MSFKKIAVSAIAAAAVATSAFAGTATLTLDNKGDYLNYPAYYATTDGWSTNIRVVNTNLTHAIVAKVVVREYATSKELLDFPIYLSPGDVWTGDLINQGAANSVNFISNDDSSPEVPMNQPLNDNNPLVGTQYGYVEILAIAAKSAAIIHADQEGGTTGYTPWTQFTPLDKAEIKADFATAATDADWVAPMHDLFGQQVVTATTAGAEKSMTLMATAMDIVDDEQNWKTNYGILFGGDTTANSIWYDSTSTVVAGEGVEFDIRNQLLRSEVHAINYVDGVGETQVILTQAYKHTNIDDEGANPDRDGGDAIFEAGETPIDAADFEVPYHLNTMIVATGLGGAMEDDDTDAYGSQSEFYFMGRAWDESENTVNPEDSIYSGSDTTTEAERCPTEICYLYTSDNGNYSSGWVNYTLGTTSTGTAYENLVPTISTILTGVRVNGVGITNMLPSAYETDIPTPTADGF
jgi:hypothetical protein